MRRSGTLEAFFKNKQKMEKKHTIGINKIKSQEDKKAYLIKYEEYKTSQNLSDDDYNRLRTRMVRDIDYIALLNDEIKNIYAEFTQYKLDVLYDFETMDKEKFDEFESKILSLKKKRDTFILKQKSKINLKINLSADSSFIIYSKADKSPEYYKNGEEGLADFILSEIEYPKLAIEKSIEGTVTIEFIIETNGYVSNLIIKNGIGAGCSEEALRIIKQTKWQSAVINNKLVRYKTTYPITFSLRNVNKDNGTSSQSFGQ